LNITGGLQTLGMQQDACSYVGVMQALSHQFNIYSFFIDHLTPCASLQL
jgi:hypothetical protein